MTGFEARPDPASSLSGVTVRAGRLAEVMRAPVTAWPARGPRAQQAVGAEDPPQHVRVRGGGLQLPHRLGPQTDDVVP